MNDKIYEFATRAGLITFESIHDSMAVTPSIESVAKARKFAELIIRECADIAKHHVSNISTYSDAEFVDEQIREHFGVEE
jgi:hypothetical protein